MEESIMTKTCSGDCMKCNVQQRIYCSAQMTRNLIEAVNALNAKVDVLAEKVESLSNDDADIFNPMGEIVSGEEEIVEEQAQ